MKNLENGWIATSAIFLTEVWRTPITPCSRTGDLHITWKHHMNVDDRPWTSVNFTSLAGFPARRQHSMSSCLFPLRPLPSKVSTFQSAAYLNSMIVDVLPGSWCPPTCPRDPTLQALSLTWRCVYIAWVSAILSIES